MAHIKEPLDVDFFVEPQPLTETERKMISAHIESYKKKHKHTKKNEGTTLKKQLETIAQSPPQ
jgi:hypothetical protein